MGEGRFERGVHGRDRQERPQIEHTPDSVEHVHASTRAQLDNLAAEIENPRLQRWARVRNRAETDPNFRANLALGFDLPRDAPLNQIEPLWYAHERLRDARRLGLPDSASDMEIFAEMQRRDQGGNAERLARGE